MRPASRSHKTNSTNYLNLHAGLNNLSYLANPGQGFEIEVFVMPSKCHRRRFHLKSNVLPRESLPRGFEIEVFDTA